MLVCVSESLNYLLVSVYFLMYFNSYKTSCFVPFITKKIIRHINNISDILAQNGETYFVVTVDIFFKDELVHLSYS